MSGTNSKEPSNEEGFFKCKYCGATESQKWGKFDQPWKLGNHVKYECEAFKKFKEAEKKTGKKGEVGEEFPTRPSVKDFEPEELVAFYGEEGLEMIMEQRLHRLLEAPGIGAKSRKFIMAEWEADETIRRDFDRLFRLLIDSGVQERIAYRIVSALVAIHDKYQPGLERYPRMFLSRRRVGRPEPYFGARGYPERQSFSRWGGWGERRYPGYGYSEEQHYTREDIERARGEERTAHRMDRIEEKTGDFSNRLESMKSEILRGIRETQPKEATSGKVVVEEYPIDEEGKPADAKSAITIKRVTRPVEEKRETLKDTLKELTELGVIFTADKVKEIVKEAKPSGEPDETPAMATLRETVKSQGDKIEEMKAEGQKEKEERLKGTIDDLSDEVKTLRTEMGRGPRGEYSADEYKYLDTITREAASRRPLEVVVNFGREMLGLSGETPGRPAAEGGRGRIIKKLRGHGLTVPE